MGKEKYSKRQLVVFVTIFIGSITSGILLDNYKGKYRTEKINEGAFIVYGTIEKLRSSASKGHRYTSRKDIVYMYYIKNDSVYHIIKDLSRGEIEKLGIQLGDCFELKIANSDNDIFEVNFNKKLDTCIDKNIYPH